MNKGYEFIGAILAIVIYVVLVGCLFALPTRLIVNYLFSPQLLWAIFNHPQITFWNAFWLNILCGLLFKSSSSSSKSSNK